MRLCMHCHRMATAVFLTNQCIIPTSGCKECCLDIVLIQNIQQSSCIVRGSIIKGQIDRFRIFPARMVLRHRNDMHRSCYGCTVAIAVRYRICHRIITRCTGIHTAIRFDLICNIILTVIQGSNTRIIRGSSKHCHITVITAIPK